MIVSHLNISISVVGCRRSCVPETVLLLETQVIEIEMACRLLASRQDAHKRCSLSSIRSFLQQRHQIESKAKPRVHMTSQFLVQPVFALVSPLESHESRAGDDEIRLVEPVE